MNEKDAENLRDIITEIESIAGTEPDIIHFEEKESFIELDLHIEIKKERPPKHD